MHVRSQAGENYQLEHNIASGGEARIWSVKGRPDLLAKIYLKADPARETKLQAMLAAPPRSVQGHTAVAWPQALLYQGRQFVGFVMPHLQHYQPIFNIYHPVKRKQSFAGINAHFLHRTAHNLAIAVATVHARGHLIGDLNESNILVNRHALVTLVDSDSFQITDSNGVVYRCPVGKAEYTPPELQAVNFQTVNRLPAHDHFGLAVLIFQLLMAGFHPYAGILTGPTPVERIDLHCLKQGWFPYVANRFVIPPPNAPAFDLLHPGLQQLFRRCFVNGQQQPERRPTAQEWQHALEKASQALTTCHRNPEHIYSNHRWRCPWCLRQRQQHKAGSARSWPLHQTIVGLAAIVTPPLVQAGHELRQRLPDLPWLVSLLQYRRLVWVFCLALLAIGMDLTGYGLVVVPIAPGYVDLTNVPAIIGTVVVGPLVGLGVAALLGVYHQWQAIAPPLRDPWVAILPALVLSLFAYGTYWLLCRWNEFQALAFSAMSGVLGQALMTSALLFYHGELTQQLSTALLLHASLDMVGTALITVIVAPILRRVLHRFA
jgi:DNA-binding helix-hairpin-helix protein with protein kinase domain